MAAKLFEENERGDGDAGNPVKPRDSVPTLKLRCTDGAPPTPELEIGPGKASPELLFAMPPFKPVNDPAFPALFRLPSMLRSVLKDERGDVRDGKASVEGDPLLERSRDAGEIFCPCTDPATERGVTEDDPARWPESIYCSSASPYYCRAVLDLFQDAVKLRHSCVKSVIQ